MDFEIMNKALKNCFDQENHHNKIIWNNSRILIGDRTVFFRTFI